MFPTFSQKSRLIFTLNNSPKATEKYEKTEWIKKSGEALLNNIYNKNDSLHIL